MHLKWPRRLPTRWNGPWADNSIGPTRATATTFHGWSAYSRCQPVVFVGRPCLLAWQTSHYHTRSRMSQVILDQYHRSCRHLVTRLAPAWACLWLSQISSCRRARGHTTQSLSCWRMSAASVIIKIPLGLTLRESQQRQRSWNSTSPCRCCSSLGCRHSFLAWKMSAIAPGGVSWSRHSSLTFRYSVELARSAWTSSEWVSVQRWPCS